jgi:hypothetical protein
LEKQPIDFGLRKPGAIPRPWRGAGIFGEPVFQQAILALDGEEKLPRQTCANPSHTLGLVYDAVLAGRRQPNDLAGGDEGLPDETGMVGMPHASQHFVNRLLGLEQAQAELPGDFFNRHGRLVKAIDLRHQITLSPADRGKRFSDPLHHCIL